MNKQTRQRVALFAAALALAACAAPERRATGDAAARYELRLLGTQSFEHGLQFGGTTVGGLSGIDFDPEADLYYLISDDRSNFAPNRFYTARLAIDEAGFHDARLEQVVTLLQADRHPYPENTADSEAIRFDPLTRSLRWTSEGARKVGASRRRDASRLIDPFVRHSTLDGRHLGELPPAPMFHITAEPHGPRDNLVFEGLALTPDGQSLWVAMEGPLLQDGPMATMSDGAWSRISRYDRASDDGFGALRMQYAYTDGATDVKAIDSLIASETSFHPMTKHLVLDFDTLGILIDNLEGICFGPTLANGHRTLALVSDDNFNAGQTTQLLALEIIPR